MAPGKAASFDLGTANATAIRTTAAYRIQVEAAWSNTNITIPVCGERPAMWEQRRLGHCTNYQEAFAHNATCIQEFLIEAVVMGWLWLALQVAILAASTRTRACQPSCTMQRSRRFSSRSPRTTLSTVGIFQQDAYCIAKFLKNPSDTTPGCILSISAASAIL